MSDKIYIMDDTLELKGVVDNYESCIVKLVHGDVSFMDITLDTEANNADQLIIGNIVYFADQKDYPFFITEAPTTFDASGRFKHIRAYDVFWLFKGRLANATDTDVTYSSKSVEYIIKNLISNNITGDRELTYLSVATNTDKGSTIDRTVKQIYLYDEGVNLLAIDTLGMKGTWDGTDIEIDLYEGTDRSSTVKFSVDFNNLLAGETLSSKTFVKNYAYVLGVDGSGNRIIEEVGTATDNDRREIVVDGGDISDTGELADIGTAALQTIEEGATYSTQALGGSFLYGTDYYLGDEVSVAGSTKRITEVEIVRESGNPKQVFLTFGKAAKKSSDQMSDLDKRVTKLETKETSGGGGATTFDALTDTPANKTGSAKKIPRVNVGETALEYKDLGVIINDATSKTTPVDADTFAGSDSAASNVLKKFSWANIKATILSFLQGLGFCQREVLTANRTYYTAPGSGAVTGAGTIGDPFTGTDVIQYVHDVVGALDISIYNVTIDYWSATGTGTVNYYPTAKIEPKDPLGSGIVYVVGNSANQDSVIVNAGSFDLYLVENVYKFNFRNFKCKGNSSYDIWGIVDSKIIHDGIHCEDGVLGISMLTSKLIYNDINNDIKFSGAFSSAVYRMQLSSKIDSFGEHYDTDSLTSFGKFYWATDVSIINVKNSVFSTTAITGTQYAIDGNSVLEWGTGTVPGNTSGATSNGGVAF